MSDVKLLRVKYQKLYEYATGLILALEKNIINKDSLARMMDSPDITGSFNVLNDTDLKDNISGIKVEKFEDAIRKDSLQLKHLIEQITDRDLLYKLIFIDEDFFNLKLIFKEKLSGTKFNESDFSGLGVQSVEELKEILKDAESLAENNTDAHLIKIVARLKKMSEEDAERLTDSVIDIGYFEYAIGVAQKLKSGVLSDFFRLNIDSKNIKNVLRGKKIGLAPEEIEKQLIPQDGVETENLKKILENYEEKTFIDFLKNNPPRPIEEKIGHRKQWEKFFESYQTNHNIVKLETDLNIFILKFLRDEVSGIGPGPEIVFYYAYLKNVMNGNIRLILASKLNNIPVEEIKARLRI